MRFCVLGSLEIVDDGPPVELSGVKQRAVLGYLLLHANNVVPTSHVVKALWADGVPSTGRKMVQNAVSGIRRTLASRPHAPGRTPMLLTHAPGYLLRVDPESVDLHHFQTLAERGRAELAEGLAEPAARTLREALGLWRGPALADLVETGIAWPELAALEKVKLVALEDRFEAELSCGRHHEVIAELEEVVAAEPLRERLCGQLMLALYRSGRQADALDAYRRTYALLVDGLGIEPGRELRELQRMILNQDAALTVSAGQIRVATALAPRTIPGQRQLSPEPPARAEKPVEPVETVAAAPVTAVRMPPSAPADARAERKNVSAVLVSAHLGPGMDTADPEDVDEAMRGIGTIIGGEVRRFDGVAGGSIGPTYLMLFGVPRNHENDAERAVRAALAIRDRFLADEIPELGSRAATGISVGVAVATGSALVRYAAAGCDAPPVVTGAVIHGCAKLLNAVPAGDVLVCDATRHATAAAITYAPVPGGGRGALAVAPAPRSIATPEAGAGRLVGRDHELQVLRSLLGQVRGWRRPHLVTLLGEPGIGKSRLLAEFGSQAAERGEIAAVLTGNTQPFAAGAPYAALTGVLREHCGFSATDPAVRVREKIAAAIDGLAVPAEAAAWMRENLCRLAGLGERPADPGQLLAAWCRFVEAIAVAGPVVVVLEDLHWATDELLDFVDELSDHAAPVPLFVVATARPELLQRRPGWGGGRRHATTTTMDPLSDNAITGILRHLVAGGTEDAEDTDPIVADSLTEFCRVLAARVGGNPLFAVEYARVLADRLRSGDWPDAGRDQLPLPQAVHSVIAARLDTLPEADKAVLLDASVVGEPVTPAVVAAVGERDQAEVARSLGNLERLEFLRRARPAGASGEAAYTFGHSLVRDVAYAQLPRSERADKQRRAREWGAVGWDSALAEEKCAS
ncbi:BTAD domain-containing putative transcriptional regulator [Amycolatopsis sp. 195334CR]|uniref:BTAD domain-containing putative transcriptional regulator n=1 Tax=Amycolatopsis sp. 195334CR TaxID=2814588 RepID=UPI001A8F02D4|nr:BTAD domain-containing putative transcriptional regulator [Amycolatopsis sp. 195334CR]MBN6040672.1 AAA family ATPase [Amycolatopsis sp. 195334CR]